MNSTTRLLAWFTAIFVALIVVVVIVGVVRSTLDPGVALGLLAPIPGGLLAAIVAKASSDKSKDDR